MTKGFITLIVVLGLSRCINAQDFRRLVNESIDQLKEDSDTIRFNAMINLATYYNFLSGKSDSVNFYADQGLRLANLKQISAWQMRAYYYKGLYHQRYSLNNDSAIYYFTTLEKLTQESGRIDKLGPVYNAIGGVWFAKGNYEKALNYYTKVFELSKDMNDYTTMTNAQSNISSIYSMMGQELKSIRAAKEALELNALDTTADQINSYLNITLNLLDTYISIDSLVVADSLMKSIEDKAMKADYPVYRDRFISNQLKYYQAVGDEVALIRLASSEYDEIVESSQIHPNIYDAISYYYALGLVQGGQVDEAKKVENDLANRKVNQEISFINIRNQFLFDLNKKLGNYKEALHYLEEYNELNDSLVGEERSLRMDEVFAKYEVEKRERQLREAENESLKLRRNIAILIAVISGLIAAVSLFYLWSYRKRQREKEEMYNIEQKMLSLQMNPHFIFNAISSIQNYLFDEGDTKKALRHLSTFSNLMRQILENSREKWITIESEISFLKDYLELQRLRFDNQFNFKIEIDPDIDAEQIFIPPLLTQPFVENAIEHGELHRVKDGNVVIRMQMEGDRLLIEILDNGIGIEASKRKGGRNLSKKSLAIKITKERLDLLNKLMKDKFTMNIVSDSRNPGTHVQLKLPKIYL